MIESPLTFLEVQNKLFFPYSPEFGKTKLGITPKTFNAVDVIFAPRKLVFMVMNAVMLIAVGH